MATHSDQFLWIIDLEEQLLILDRQAILGKLSAGLVHAVNNVLSGVLGQVDLLLLTRREPQIQTDLEQIATTCEQGVLLTKSLTRVISSMKETQSTDPRSIVEALFTLLGRIYRRAGVEKELQIKGIISQAKNGDEYVQALFQLMVSAYESLSVAGITSRKVTGRLSSEKDRVLFELESLSLLMQGTSSSEIQPGNVVLADEAWQKWVLNTVTRRCNGEWKVENDGRKLSLSWPAANGMASMIY